MPSEHLQGGGGGACNASHSLCGIVTDRVLLVISEGKAVGLHVSSLPNSHLCVPRV